MKAESHSIFDILTKNNTSFFIPPFQRAYAWGNNELERFFYDVSRIIESELDNGQSDKLEHFFGSIVIKEEKGSYSDKSILVDGQQRLTTTLIFLIALRDLANDGKITKFINDNCLRNNSSTFDDKIKLKQVTKDWESYKALVNKNPAPQGIINNAYNKFTDLIKKAKSNNPKINLEHYLTAIKRLNVAVIYLDERPSKGEDPQIIFETLNSLGKPLTLSDLIRNYVLFKMNSYEQTEIYEKIWVPKIENVLQQKTSEFFRDYLQLKTAKAVKAISDNNTKEIYQKFKDFVDKNFNNNSDFINDIVRYANWYNWIISENNIDKIANAGTNNKEIIELLRNIFHDIKSEAFKPFVLGLLESHQDGLCGVKLNDNALIDILKTIRTYLIRRRILYLHKGENIAIPQFSAEIKKIVSKGKTLFDILSKQPYNLRIPDDDELKNYLLTKNIYQDLNRYAKFILGKIEEHHAKVAVDFRDPQITIEHIMPQTLNDDWKAKLGKDFKEIHLKFLHNIGNLILTEFNGEMGNKSFEEKKSALSNSSLHYRIPIQKEDKWDLNSILRHRDYMIKSLLETFPLPANYNNI